MSYNTKNYTEQGGDRTHIGGVLIFDRGGSIKGFPGAANQAASTATTVATLKDDLNAVLVKLKDAGLMTPDEFQVTAALAPTPTEDIVAANNGKVSSVTLEDDVISIRVDLEQLTPSASSDPAQGTHKWLCLGIGTGLSSITAVKYNGNPLTDADVADATACGCSAGSFVLYVKAEVVAEEGKAFTLNADGYAEKTVSVAVLPAN